MTFKEAVKESLIQGFSNSDLTTSEILITLLVAFFISLYIFVLYRIITKNAFYSKSFNIAMAIMSMITAGIILAMQSSLVISLGMVGALSIVRFRTAIKEPMDLLFLFWSIGSGIICGAGLFKIGVVLAVGVTIAIIFLQLIPEGRTSKILFISSQNKEIEKELTEPLKNNAIYYKVKSRNMTGSGMDIVYEVKSKNDAKLVEAISSMQEISTVSLISHDGEFRG